MTKEQLQAVSGWFREKPLRLTALRAADHICVGCAAAAFAYGVLIRPGLQDPKLTLRLILTCGIPFVLMSAVRRLIDRPRPFEVYDLEPLLPRESRGKGFPSRHVFSICVIGASFLYLEPWIGVTLLVLAVPLAALRVLAAVHFPRDVLFGAAIGVLSAVIGFSL